VGINTVGGPLYSPALPNPVKYNDNHPLKRDRRSLMLLDSKNQVVAAQGLPGFLSAPLIQAFDVVRRALSGGRSLAASGAHGLGIR
jgi:hypothetical protein